MTMCQKKKNVCLSELPHMLQAKKTEQPKSDKYFVKISMNP